MNQTIPPNELLYKIRMEHDFTVEDVANIVGVSTRQVAAWESGSQRVPTARLQLLRLKTEHKAQRGDLVTVLGADGTNFIDVVSERNFAGMKLYGDGTGIIKSVAVDRTTGKLRMHSTTFIVDVNEHVARMGIKWQRNLDIGMRPIFADDPDPVAISMASWLGRQVQQFEEQNPKIRSLKDRMTSAVNNRDSTWSQEERDQYQREFDEAMAELNRLIGIN